MRFLKVILPPLLAFWAFALFIKFTPFFEYVNSSEKIGEDSVYGLISYYKVFAPFQIIIALLTQWLIALPLWDRITKHPKAAWGIFIGMALICFVAALGIAYMIWDKPTGVSHMLNIALFMAAVQLFYWTVNFLILFLLSWKSFFNSSEVKEEEVTE